VVNQPASQTELQNMMLCDPFTRTKEAELNILILSAEESRSSSIEVHIYPSGTTKKIKWKKKETKENWWLVVKFTHSRCVLFNSECSQTQSYTTQILVSRLQVSSYIQVIWPSYYQEPYSIRQETVSWRILQRNEISILQARIYYTR
jgi:hypothetical protein